MCLYKYHIYCMFKYISNLCYNGLPKTSETKGVEPRQFNSNIKKAYLKQVNIRRLNSGSSIPYEPRGYLRQVNLWGLNSVSLIPI